MDFNVFNVGSKVIEDNFSLSRPDGLITKYDFIHFLTDVTIEIDGVSKTYAPGVCILYTPEFPQYYKNVNGWINHDWIEFECKDRRFFEMLKFPLNKPFYTQISKKISDQIGKMREVFKVETMFTQAELNCELYSLLLTISKHLHSKQTNAYATNLKETRNDLARIRLELYQDPGTLNVKSLANKYGFIDTHFCSIYKKIFHTTVHDDITKARLQYVEKTLLSNGKPYQIADHLGFSSVEYLYMWFKKQTGKTIGSYLKETK